MTKGSSGRGRGCEWYRARIGGRDQLDEHELRAIEDHLATCQECIDALTAGLNDAPEMVGAVMQRLGMDPCAQASLLLASDDDDRDQTERDLLRGHVEHCEACTQLEAVLLRLDSELPAMAEIDPGGDFIGEVLTITCGAPAPERPLRDWIERISLRPRFALEAAYLLAAVLVLVVGVHRPIEAVVRKSHVPAEAVLGGLSDLSMQTHHGIASATEGLQQAVSGSVRTTSDGYRQVIHEISSLREQGLSLENESLEAPDHSQPNAEQNTTSNDDQGGRDDHEKQ